MRTVSLTILHTTSTVSHTTALRYALSRHAPLLTAALGFRNTHVDEPFFCRPLLRPLGRGPLPAPAPPSGLSLGYELAEICWPAGAEEAVRGGHAERLPDGRTSLR